MKIAIQEHSARGHEVIQILESLEGKNTTELNGRAKAFYYIDKGEIHNDYYLPKDYKAYTLEEFEKEFPFKIGDSVVFKNATNNPRIYTISELVYYDNQLLYKLKDVPYHYLPSVLKLHISMKERNITLTLDKAKEWYNKGGELKEIALQAFSEKELNPLPKSWEDYCKMYTSQASQSIFIIGHPKKYIAFWKLEQLRDCYRQGWKPDWTSSDSKYCINNHVTGQYIGILLYTNAFLSFQSREVAKEFLKNFERLIKEAGDLI